MAIVTFTLNEEGVTILRDALICLNKFSDDVSLEARKDKLTLTALNTSKSAYGCCTFATNRFFSRYQYVGSALHKEKFYCTLYIRALISIFRARSGGGDANRDRELQSTIEKCEVTIDDGPDVPSRFAARLVFRNGMTSTHKLPFEVAVPVHGKFDKQEAVHHWTIPSRTMRQLMEHFGPGIDWLDINSDGENVKFICTSEKRVNGEDALKKPLQTSIAIDVDEFDDIEVEDKLHIIISVKDFRAIIQHAAVTGNDLTARYSVPTRPIQLSYHGDGITCEFLLMTVGERGSNPAQKTRKTRGVNGRSTQGRPTLDAGSRRASAVPSLPPDATDREGTEPTVAEAVTVVQPQLSGVIPNPHLGHFDLRPPNRTPAPPATMRSEGLFVENDEAWEPVPDEDEEDGGDDAQLMWESGQQPNQGEMRMSMMAADENTQAEWTPASSGIAGLEPTQRLSDVRRLGLFYNGN